MCANFLYDLNGKKGPNTVGKDVGFMTVFYPSDPVVVAPVPMANNATSATSSDAPKVCSSLCDEYRLPNKEEMASITLNKKFVGNVSGSFATTSRIEDNVQTPYSTGNHWLLESSGWYIARAYSSTSKFSVRCIKR